MQQKIHLVGESQIRAEPTRIQRGLRFAGLGLYLALGIVPYSSSGLVAPMAGVAVLYLGWLSGLGAIVGLWRRSPASAAMMPVFGLAYWWAVVTVGELFLGWVA